MKKREETIEGDAIFKAAGDGNVPKAEEVAHKTFHAGPHPESFEGGKNRGAFLGSGARPCKEVSPDDDENALPTWSSLQSHSFVTWCSSLMRKALGSGTKFGAFLHATSQVVRAGRPVSAKAIFPLPVPVPGVFGVQGGRLSSQKRRKRHFEQAFHIVVMALNYLHADFQFVDLKLLARPPNAAQVEALQNLRRILLAFGHSAGEISVPASGRRCTSLVSLLADLSEFLTQEGVVDSAYHRGFPGVEKEGILPKKKSSLDKEEKGQTSSVVREGAVVPQDVEKAPELIPYRDLEPSRLKLSGTAQWCPAPYLDDQLWMAFQEPMSLRWTSDFIQADLPDLDREDPDKILQLAKVWDINGLLHLAPPVLEESMVPSCLRVFNCLKSSLVDRQIGDRRGLPPWTVQVFAKWVSPWSFGGRPEGGVRCHLHFRPKRLLPPDISQPPKGLFQQAVASSSIGVFERHEGSWGLCGPELC